jgi:hypothetical protein
VREAGHPKYNFHGEPEFYVIKILVLGVSIDYQNYAGLAALVHSVISPQGSILPLLAKEKCLFAITSKY